MAEIKTDVRYAHHVAEHIRSVSAGASIPGICRAAGATNVSVQEECVSTYGRLANVSEEAQSHIARFASYIVKSAEDFERLDQDQRGAWSV